jgi:septum formation protein
VPDPTLILASASPRRAELLREAGYLFTVRPADIDEQAVARGKLPFEAALELAIAKADVVATAHPAAVVVAADTVVAFGDQVIGKPADAQAARQALQLLSGTTHLVITGVAVVHVGGKFSRHLRVASAVRMKDLSPSQIDAYIGTGQWQGKAGGYGIQDPDPFIRRITGSQTNIVGLPMEETKELLDAAGIGKGGKAASASSEVTDEETE